jgi:ABC-type multidrug transport system ATPase subunit
METLKKRIQPDDIVLISTHRPRTIALSNRMIVMVNGQIAADGSTEEIIKKLRALPAKNSQTAPTEKGEETAAQRGQSASNEHKGGEANVGE